MSDITLLKKIPKNIYDKKEIVLNKNITMSTNLEASPFISEKKSNIDTKKIPYEKILENISLNIISQDSKILSFLSKNISKEIILSQSNITKKDFNIPILEYFKLPIKNYFEYRIDAKKATWDSEKKYWKLSNVYKRIWDEKSRSIKLERYDSYILKTKESHDFLKTFFTYSRKVPKELSLDEGKKMINYLKMSKRKWENFYIDLYADKLAFPLSTILLTIMGSFISKFHSRKLLFLSSLFKSTLIFILYFITFKFGISFSKITFIFPIFLSPWIGTFLFFLLCIFFGKKVKT